MRIHLHQKTERKDGTTMYTIVNEVKIDPEGTWYRVIKPLQLQDEALIVVCGIQLNPDSVMALAMLKCEWIEQPKDPLQKRIVSISKEFAGVPTA